MRTSRAATRCSTQWRGFGPGLLFNAKERGCRVEGLGDAAPAPSVVGGIVSEGRNQANDLIRGGGGFTEWIGVTTKEAWFGRGEAPRGSGISPVPRHHPRRPKRRPSASLGPLRSCGGMVFFVCTRVCVSVAHFVYTSPNTNLQIITKLM